MKSLKKLTNEYISAYGMIRPEAEKKAQKDLKALQDMEKMVEDFKKKLSVKK